MYDNIPCDCCVFQSTSSWVCPYIICCVESKPDGILQLVMSHSNVVDVIASYASFMLMYIHVIKNCVLMLLKGNVRCIEYSYIIIYNSKT